VYLGPGEGPQLRVPGHPLVVPKLVGADTGGVYSLLEMTVPEAGLPRHIHRAEEEVFYIMEGTVRVQRGEETIDAGAGSLVQVPRGTPHTFWNAGDTPARLLAIFSPAGFEGFFAEAAQLKQEPGTPAFFHAMDGVRSRHHGELAEG
jgi:quercetin dioxygenase-like cupin family protein